MAVTKRASLSEILSAIRTRLTGTGLPLDRIKLVARHSPDLPKFTAEQDILLRSDGFVADPGHRDRHDCRVTRLLSVTIRTRAQPDEGDRDTAWLTDLDRGSIVWEEDVLDLLQGWMPMSQSQDSLVSSTLAVVRGEARRKAREDAAWGEVELFFELHIRLPLTQRTGND